MTSATRALSAHKAYVERVKAGFHGSRYDWLIDRLSRPKHHLIPVKHKNSSCLCILDFDGNLAPKEVLRAEAGGELHDGVLDALHSELSPTALRVVWLGYDRICHLNSEFVGTIGYALDLDPSLFNTHFQKLNIGRFGGAGQPPSLSHLDTSILHFNFPEDGHISTCIEQNVVLMLHECPPGDIQTIHKLMVSSSMKPSCWQNCEALSGPKLPPIDIVAMVLQVDTLRLVTKIDAEDRAIREHRVRIQATIRDLSAALASEQWSKGHAPLAQRVLQEYNIVLDRSRLLCEYYRELLQHVNTMTSIEETRRGIKQSDSVRRLTLVAFVFIPLNFATSFFGMNVQQLGTGSINIGYFFLAAGLILFAALLSFTVKPLERRLKRKQKEIADKLYEDAEVMPEEDIQKREVLRQSKLGKKLWARTAVVVGLDEDDVYEFERPGPKFRKTIKLLANHHWEKLTSSFPIFIARQRVDPEQQTEDDGPAD